MRQPVGISVVMVVLAWSAGCDRSPEAPTTPSPLQRDALEIRSVTPVVALTETNTEVKISGRGFAPGVTVTFGGEPAEVLSVAATLLAVRTPSRGPGDVSIDVTHPDGRRATHHTPFRFVDVQFRQISPDRGVPTMLTVLSIGHFPPGARVTFGGLDAVVTVSSNGIIFARVPDNGAAAGPVDVAVIRPDGRADTLAGAFTYVPVAITPSTLSIAAGAPMTVSWVNPVDWYNDFFTDGLSLHRVGDQTALPVWRGDVGTATGAYSLLAPVEPGAYQFRFFVDSQRVLAGVSQTIIVTAAPEGDR